MSFKLLKFYKNYSFFTYSYSKLIEFYEYKKKCGKNYFKGPKMAAKDDATILFAATILTAPTVLYHVDTGRFSHLSLKGTLT